MCTLYVCTVLYLAPSLDEVTVILGVDGDLLFHNVGLWERNVEKGRQQVKQHETTITCLLHAHTI